MGRCSSGFQVVYWVLSCLEDGGTATCKYLALQYSLQLRKPAQLQESALNANFYQPRTFTHAVACFSFFFSAYYSTTDEYVWGRTLSQICIDRRRGRKKAQSALVSPNEDLTAVCISGPVGKVHPIHLPVKWRTDHHVPLPSPHWAQIFRLVILNGVLISEQARVNRRGYVYT